MVNHSLKRGNGFRLTVVNKNDPLHLFLVKEYKTKDEIKMNTYIL